MRHFIALGPGAGWGRGYAAEEAVRNMKTGGVGDGERYETFEVHAKTTVNEVGIMSWPKGHPPISLGVTNPKTKYTPREPGVPTLDFRGTPSKSSHRKVRVTEAEQKRIDARVAEVKAIRSRINASHKGVRTAQMRNGQVVSVSSTRQLTEYKVYQAARVLLRKALPILEAYFDSLERETPGSPGIAETYGEAKELQALINEIRSEIQ